jgi:hypothetical protein
MTVADRYTLLGTYRTPRFKYGDTVLCEKRGFVKDRQPFRCPHPLAALSRRQGPRVDFVRRSCRRRPS